MQVLAVPPFSRQGFGLSFFVYVFFLHLVYFCKLFAFEEKGLLCLWLFARLRTFIFRLRVFSALNLLSRTSFVRVKVGGVVVCKALDGNCPRTAVIHFVRQCSGVSISVYALCNIFFLQIFFKPIFFSALSLLLRTSFVRGEGIVWVLFVYWCAVFVDGITC